MVGEIYRTPRRWAGRSARIAALAAGYGLAVWALGSSAAGVRAAASAPGPLRPDAAVATGGLIAAWVILIWWGVTFLLLVVAGLPGYVGRLADACAQRITPVAVARLARYVLGVTLATGTSVGGASAAQATVTSAAPDPGPDLVTPTLSLDRPVPRELDRPHAVHRHGPRSLLTPTAPTSVQATVPRSVPTAPSTARPTAPAAVPSPSTAPTVVVRRGDSLWAIAARHLPPGAPAARVAAEWPRWYRANVDVVGMDPDLIRPGQRLRPALTEETR